MFSESEIIKSRLFGIDFDVVTMNDAVEWVYRSVARGVIHETQYVVTPNVSITMMHQESAKFRKVIHHSSLTIADGMPLVKASRWFGKPLPERVAGSDLVYSVFDAAIEEMPLTVFLLGAAPGVADRAAEVIHSRWPPVRVVGTLSPDFGFENSDDENTRILDAIKSASPDILIIGLGAPKQETWAYNHRKKSAAAVTFCVGGTIDFIAGEQKRAPAWVRKSGVEWFWRMATNPRRLVGRYVRDAIRLPKLLLDEFSGLCPFHQASNYSEVTSRPKEVSTPIDREHS